MIKESYMDFDLRNAVLDEIRIDLLGVVKQLQKQQGLTIFDMENVLYQVLADVKTEKEISYANTITSLTKQVRQLEKEKKEQMQKEQEPVIAEQEE